MAAWFAASVGGFAPWWLAVMSAISGFLLSFRFPETRVAPVIDALTVGLWAVHTGSPAVAAAALVFPVFGRLADGIIFRHEPGQGRKR